MHVTAARQERGEVGRRKTAAEWPDLTSRNLKGTVKRLMAREQCPGPLGVFNAPTTTLDGMSNAGPDRDGIVERPNNSQRRQGRKR